MSLSVYSGALVSVPAIRLLLPAIGLLFPAVSLLLPAVGLLLLLVLRPAKAALPGLLLHSADAFGDHLRFLTRLTLQRLLHLLLHLLALESLLFQLLDLLLSQACAAQFLADLLRLSLLAPELLAALPHVLVVPHAFVLPDFTLTPLNTR